MPIEIDGTVYLYQAEVARVAQMSLIPRDLKNKIRCKSIPYEYSGRLMQATVYHIDDAIQWAEERAKKRNEKIDEDIAAFLRAAAKRESSAKSTKNAKSPNR